MQYGAFNVSSDNLNIKFEQAKQGREFRTKCGLATGKYIKRNAGSCQA